MVWYKQHKYVRRDRCQPVSNVRIILRTSARYFPGMPPQPLSTGGPRPRPAISLPVEVVLLERLKGSA